MHFLVCIYRIYWLLIKSFHAVLIRPWWFQVLFHNTVCNLFTVRTSGCINSKLAVIREQLANYLPVYDIVKSWNYSLQTYLILYVKFDIEKKRKKLTQISRFLSSSSSFCSSMRKGAREIRFPPKLSFQKSDTNPSKAVSTDVTNYRQTGETNIRIGRFRRDYWFLIVSYALRGTREANCHPMCTKR